VAERIATLDSVRGLAALSVVTVHGLTVYPTFRYLNHSSFGWIVTRTPLVLFYAGHEAVILFFVLSGFVLALPYLSERPPTYPIFVIRRICRIYLPYLAALCIALAARSLVTIHPVAGTERWFGFYWSVDPNIGNVVGYILMTGFSHHENIDPAVWTLIHEMRISLIFPVLFWLTARLSPAAYLPGFLAASILCAVATSVHSPGPDPDAQQMTLRTFLDTGCYVWFFVLGIWLARHRKRIGELCGRWSLPAVIVALALYCVRFEFSTEGNVVDYLDYVVGFGAALFIAIAIGSKPAKTILTLRPCLFLGHISYSLYLIHPIVLLTMIYGLAQVTGPVPVLIAFPFVSIGAAYLMMRYVEISSQELGRIVTRRMLAAAPSV
jgi:peptidoglycan/LPS O-acetylase OafA/YrhL